MFFWNLLCASLPLISVNGCAELHERSVYLVTNRQIQERSRNKFSKKRAPTLSYGVCESASTADGLCDKDTWYQDLIRSPQWQSDHQLIFFVHGYSMSYRKTRRIAIDMSRELNRPVVFFSWPSQANPFAYSKDARAAKQTVPEVARVLRDLGSILGFENIIIVSHSMGAKIIQNTLELAGSSAAVELPASGKIKAIYFCSPDISKSSFLLSAEVIKNQCSDAKIIASSHDIRIRISELLHGDKSIGLIRENTLNCGGISILPIDSQSKGDWGHAMPLGILRTLIERKQ